MKRLITVFIALMMICSCAAAELSVPMYNAFASVAGAPKLEQMVQSENKYIFSTDHLMIIFDTSSSGEITQAGVMLLDEEGAADFLCTCVAVMRYLGKVDMTAEGMFLNQFLSLRAGSTPTAFGMGADQYNMVLSDGKYTFLYINNE